ncbi:MAG: hybrid sensor histidine kinase/response regulator [Fibrobacteres bacterium]|nr:hybrid sensor histidine kinase/response regulator [Fibrobacterota bacterium]
MPSNFHHRFHPSPPEADLQGFPKADPSPSGADRPFSRNLKTRTRQSLLYAQLSPLQGSVASQAKIVPCGPIDPPSSLRHEQTTHAWISDETRPLSMPAMRSVWLRFGRKLWKRSSRENIRDYRDLALWLAPVAAILWPTYGFFCDRILHLRETMEYRIFLGLVCAWVWSRAWKPATWGKSERWLWFTHSVVGVGWLPWHLYFLNDRNVYWQMSLVCFAVTLPITLRGIDLPLGLVGVSLAVVATNWSEIGKQELPVLAVVFFMTTMMATCVHVWRRAQRHIEDQSDLLEKQNIRLRELDRSKDEFTANVAHDLRTPLAVALCLTDELARGRSPADRQRLESLAAALNQLHRQSEELLDFQRFQLGIAKLDLETLDVVAWLDKFRPGFSSVAHARGIAFAVVVPPERVFALLDPVRMETALFNLISNAFKFTPSGRNVEIHLETRGHSDVVIAVVDGGEGIANEAIPRIFERFQQIDRGPGTHTQGAGIGLSLVKEIVEAHGGRIHVESHLGHGSRFELVMEGSRIMVENIPTEPTPLAPTPPEQDFRKREGSLVLVADDQPMMRHLLEKVLGRIAKIVLACDGEEALRLARELRPDLIVTDNQMPRMDGIEMVALLRSDAGMPRIPVILLTGESDAALERLHPDSDVVVVRKPFQQRDLLEAAARLLDREIA